MTYPEMAEFYKVSLDELDWQDRRVTRAGLRNFLITVYRRHQAKLGRDMDEWELLWRSNVWAYSEAFWRWHRRIPKHYSNTDRAKVAWVLFPYRTPWAKRQYTIPSENRAWRWASERS